MWPARHEDVARRISASVINLHIHRIGRSQRERRMAQKIIVYWRDIPAQVIVKAGRKRATVELPERFIKAIDRTAMKMGAKDSDAYLAEWRRGEPEQVDGDLEQAIQLLKDHRALEDTSVVARAEAARAKAALAPLPDHPVKDMLVDLADYVVERIN